MSAESNIYNAKSFARHIIDQGGGYTNTICNEALKVGISKDDTRKALKVMEANKEVKRVWCNDSNNLRYVLA